MQSAVALGAAAVLLSAAACGTTKASAPAAAVSASSVSASSVSASGCPTRSAYATEVTAAGHIAWQVSLPTAADQQGIVVQPLVIGGVTVVTEENAVYGIRVSDGHKLWRHAFSASIAAESGAVYGTWRSGGTVVVLSGQVSADARLTGLTAATGQVRWTLKVPGSGLLGSQAEAGDGALAILRPSGLLESVDLASGRVLWSHQVGQSNGPAAIGSVMAAAGHGRVYGYNATTGRLLWTSGRLFQQTEVTAANGVFLASSNGYTPGQPDGTVALNPRTGRVQWRFAAETLLGAGPAGIALASYTPRRLYLLNPATGRTRWSVTTFAASEGDTPGQLAQTSTDVVLPEGNVNGSANVFRLVVRNAANGRQLWSTPIPSGPDGVNLALLPLAGGQAIAATTEPGNGFGRTSARLTVRRLATGRQLASVSLPDMIMAPLTITRTGILVQSDSPVCATALNGTATARVNHRPTCG
jgi:outer membrane protein assembly factor BamB